MFLIDEYATRIEQNLALLKRENPRQFQEKKDYLEGLKKAIEQEIVLTESGGSKVALFNSIAEILSDFSLDKEWIEQTANLILEPRFITQSIKTFFVAAFEGKVSGRYYISEKSFTSCKCWHGYKVPERVLTIENRWDDRPDMKTIIGSLVQSVNEILPFYVPWQDADDLTPIERVLIEAHYSQAEATGQQEDAHIPLDPKNNTLFLLFLQYLVELYHKYPAPVEFCKELL